MNYGAGMHRDFWAARWGQQRIGFHLPEVNPLLLSYYEQWLDLASTSQPRPLAERRILVPLCGKALDLRWLADRGAQVTGVEFVEQAALAFFEEQGLEFTTRPHRLGKELISTTDGVEIRILVADFFALSGDDVGPMNAVYDRAALIAVEPAKRARYAAQLRELCPAGAKLLLITLEHDTGGGPPFAVPRSEVHATLGETFTLELLEDRDVFASEPQFAARGASALRELVWLGSRL